MSQDRKSKPLLLSRGAEATLTKQKMFGTWIVVKERVPKPYRRVELDARLRKGRTIHEARMLHTVKKLGIRSPVLYGVNPASCTLYLEWVDAPRLKHVLLNSRISRAEKRRLCEEFGKMIGILHAHHLVHGDLTTSNALVQKKGKTNELVMIDFGLSFASRKMEDLAVDLVNLKKTFEATHAGLEEGWSAIQEAYLQNGGTPSILTHMREVENRIRYA